MNKRQNNQLNMFRTVIAVCDMHTTTVAEIPAFNNSLAALKAKVAAAATLAKQQETATTGIAGDKAKTKRNLARHASILTGVLQAYAAAAGNGQLFSEINYSESALSTMSDQRLTQVCEMIKEKAQANVDSLKDYGIMPTMITEFEQLLEQFKTAIPSTTVAINQREAHTENLDEIISEANDILKSQMDKVGKLFSTTRPEFHQLYKNSRKLRETGGKKETTSMVYGMIKGFEGGLESALVELTELGLVDSTEADGQYVLSNIEPGTYTLRISHSGYKTFEMSVKISGKEELEKNITLVKA